MRRAAKMAARYKSKDDEDDGGEDDGAAAAMQAAMGPPSLCMVFKLPDEDECIDEEYMQVKKEQRERIIGKLRNLNLNVEQVINKTKDKLFLKISANDEILIQQAEARGLKVSLLEEKYDGGMCMYNRQLQEDECFQEAADGASSSELPFTSLMQLEMTDRLVRSKPYDDGGDDADPLNPEDLMAQPEEEDEEAEIVGYFYMHFDRARVKLLAEWGVPWTKPQPLEMIRVYFGEKVALFFTFYGFYMTMLWLPAVWGLWLFTTQLASHAETQSWENPYVVVYAMCMTVWAALVGQLWRRLEGTRRYEWDTLDFEDQETELLSFRNHPETQRKKHVNETTGEIDEYYFDDGSFLPPKGRKARVLVTFSIIGVLCVVSGAFSIWIYTLCQPLMTQGDTTVGASVIGLLYTAQAEICSLGFRHLLETRLKSENWRTETEREDAMILRSALFKLFNAYFGIFFIGFAANRIPFAPGLRCPGWQCLPVLQGVFTSMMIFNFAYRLLKDKGFPALRKFATENNPFGNEALKKKAQLKVVKLPMEEQLEMENPREIVKYYEDIVVQFGYIAMFGSCFPLVGVVTLALNMIYLRTYAVDLLGNTQRPPYQCASDIGAWQDIINFLSLMAIVTNAGLCGLTGHGIYFFNPELSYVDRLWVVATLEHFLFLIKILIENMISPEPDRAVGLYQMKMDKKRAMLEEKGLVEDQFKQE
jgi:hypothetical protein